MKNTVRRLYLSLVVLTLLVSCRSNKSLTARHYNNRYYIGMSKSQGEDLVTETKTTPEENLPVGLIESNAEPVQIVTPGTQSSAPAETDGIVFIEESEAPANETGLLTKRIIEKKNGADYPSLLLKKTTEVKEKMAPQQTSDDALSLLWIVIVVILILWLFGLAFGSFGIGSAIHFLALIALILLILWLLRVI